MEQFECSLHGTTPEVDYSSLLERLKFISTLENEYRMHFALASTLPGKLT